MRTDLKQYEHFKEAFNISLPKWPQLIIVGEQITVEQAKEIIFRTDMFLTCSDNYVGGNDREFNEAYIKAAGFDKLENTFIGQDGHERKIFDYPKYETFLDSVGFIDLNYVYNRFASSSFVYGPAGFCHPDGKIHFTHNIGKYPSVEDIFEDFLKLAKAFPYLDMKASVYSDEECVSFEDGKKFLLSFIIKNGSVDITFENQNLEKQVSSLSEKEEDEIFSKIMSGDFSAERGLPQEWYVEFANRIKIAIEKINNPVLI